MLKVLSLILIASTLPATSARAAEKRGGISDGGGDYVTWSTHSAWFIGAQKPVHACIEIAPGFGKSRTELENAVFKAVRTWNQYILDKWIFGYRQLDYVPSTDVSIMGDCEHPQKADLVFYFGVENEEVKKAKERFVLPSAMAVRTDFDEKAAWGRGFVWFAMPKSLDLPTFGPGFFPDWEKPGALDAMLLHEIGHVLGNGHVDGTIMTQDIMQLVNSGESGTGVIPTTIDRSRELVTCRECEYTYASKKAVPNRKENLRRIFGVQVKDSAVITLKRATGALVGSLAFSQDDGSKETSVIFTNSRQTTLSNEVLQSVYFINRQTQATTSYGYARGPNGEHVGIVLEQNMGDAPAVLYVFIDGELSPIAELEIAAVRPK